MNRYIRWGIVLGLGVGVVALRWQRMRDLAEQRLHAAATVERVGIAVNELHRLRVSTMDLAPDVLDGADAATLVPTLMAESGMSRSQLRALRVHDAQELDRGARRQRLAITMEPVHLAPLGRFLAGWRDAAPDWIVSSIELSRSSSARDPAFSVDIEVSVITSDATWSEGQP